MGLPLISLEIFLGFGVPLAWGIWELVSLRREQRRDAEREAQRALQAGSNADETDDVAERGPPPA